MKKCEGESAVFNTNDSTEHETFEYRFTHDLLNKDDKSRYRMLSRMRADCEYYLGHGKRHPKHLWAGNEENHIKAMEVIWRSLDDSKKPEWITWEQIQSYKYQILNGRD